MEGGSCNLPCILHDRWGEMVHGCGLGNGCEGSGTVRGDSNQDRCSKDRRVVPIGVARRHELEHARGEGGGELAALQSAEGEAKGRMPGGETLGAEVDHHRSRFALLLCRPCPSDRLDRMRPSPHRGFPELMTSECRECTLGSVMDMRKNVESRFQETC
jgi:hypothetical protein